MNRKQKKLKRKMASHHKVVCHWLKGGNPRRFRKSQGRLWYRIRMSRTRLHSLSVRIMDNYLEQYPPTSNVLEL